MAAESLAYVTAVQGAVNSSYEEKLTLREFVCEDLKVKGKGHGWLWLLFALCFIGTSTFYSQLYFDVAALKEPAAYFCLPKDLKATNWTIDQIQEVSRYSNLTQSCMALKLNYKKLSEMSYEDALDVVNNMPDLDGGSCKEIGGEIFVLSGDDETYAEDFNLLCDGFDSSVYASFYKGCIYGGAVFGVLGDKLGRKTSFNIAIFPFIISAFLPAYIQSTTIYTWSRFFVGFCGYGIINLLFVMLVENSQKKLREIFAIIINLTVSFGMFWQYTMLYEADGKIRANQILLAISTVVLVAFVKFLSDSPKHLISQHKYEKAYIQLKGREPTVGEFIQDDEPTQSNECSLTKFIKSQEIVKFFCSSNYWQLTWLSMTLYGFWFFVFNFCDMKVESQNFLSHIKILTVYDAFGYIVMTFLVFFLPRKFIHISMIISMGSLLILSAALPSEDLASYQTIVTICRCLGNPVIGLFCLHIAEMFPTEIRCTAIGVIGSFGYLVGYYASNIYEFFQGLEDNYNWPKFMTLLGLLSVLMSYLVYMLPETKHEELKDYVSEKLNIQKENDDEKDEKNVEEISASSIIYILLLALCFTIFMTNFNHSA